MDNDAAIRRLRLLLQEPGALKIPTPFHACVVQHDQLEPGERYQTSARLVLNADIAADRGSLLAIHCRKYAEERGHRVDPSGGYFSVDHYILVPVKRIEPVENSVTGRWRAYADDALGMTLTAIPTELLRRLTEHERE